MGAYDHRPLAAVDAPQLSKGDSADHVLLPRCPQRIGDRDNLSLDAHLAASQVTTSQLRRSANRAPSATHDPLLASGTRRSGGALVLGESVIQRVRARGVGKLLPGPGSRSGAWSKRASFDGPPIWGRRSRCAF